MKALRNKLVVVLGRKYRRGPLVAYGPGVVLFETIASLSVRAGAVVEALG
jgi:hypothetical protein